MHTIEFRRSRRTLLIVATALLVTAGALEGASCNYGNYDGGYEGGVDTGSGALPSALRLSRTISGNKDEILTTPDGVFEVTVPKGAYSAPARIEISQGDDRTADSLVVPVYTVTVTPDTALALPVQIVFRGNNPNGGGSGRSLFVSDRRGDGTFAPVPVAGGGNTGGSSNTFWGLTKTLGTFSLIFESISTSNVFADVSRESCISQCCSEGNNGGLPGNGIAVKGGCGCLSGPNLACFLKYCPDLTLIAARCTDFGTNNSPVPLQCKPFAALGANNCPGPSCTGYSGDCNSGGPSNSVCCIANNTGNCLQNQGQCTGIGIRCDLNTKCPVGTACCVFDNDAYCTASCPTGRNPCKRESDCDGGVGDAGPGKTEGGACRSAPGCPFGTCGSPPPSCL